MPALIHRDAPGAVPADARALLQRFGLTTATLLTTDRQSPKLRHGQADARAVILHHLPARALAAAITPNNQNPAAARAFIPALFELAEVHGLTSAAAAHNGCPWATTGCGGVGGGCLVWSGHGGMGQTVAAARGRRTLALLADPAAYGRAVWWSVLRHLQRARRDGLPLAVRLRGTDDHGWHLHAVEISSSEAAAIRQRYGVDVTPGVANMSARLAAVKDLRPYEYSKAPTVGPLGLIAQRDAGVDVTASFAADRATACADGLAALDAGFRLAVPVRMRKGDPLPSHLNLTLPDREITVPTVDGDRHDHRWTDPHGVAVILRTKRSRGAGPEADRFSLAAHDQPQNLADGYAQLIWPD
jgi:hypothetical protein